MDVFEHMVDPLPTIKQFAETTPYIFCNPDDVRYGFPYPQHISRFDLTPYFEHVDRYLYKSKGYAG